MCRTGWYQRGKIVVLTTPEWISWRANSNIYFFTSWPSTFQLHKTQRKTTQQTIRYITLYHQQETNPLYPINYRVVTILCTSNWQYTTSSIKWHCHLSSYSNSQHQKEMHLSFKLCFYISQCCSTLSCKQYATFYWFQCCISCCAKSQK